MEVLSVLLFIVILLLILSLKGNLKSRLNNLETEVRKLREQLAGTQQVTSVAAPAEPIPGVMPDERGFTEPPEMVSAPAHVAPEKSLTDELEQLLQNAGPVEEAPLATRPEAIPEGAVPEPAGFQPVNVAGPEPVRERRPGFLERNPDLEKFIGENLISKIGIGILVLAIGFFVKYAIDNDWIGPVGRVGVGIICGGILVAVAHRLHNSYKAFSSVLVGGGLAIFYFTITLAYHQFHLFSQVVTFIIMVVITGFAVVLSLLYNRQEVAIIALVGGFATPFMASDGSGNYKSLFTYLIILNAGLLVIAYKKSWRLLNALAFIFTVVLFASWLVTLKAGETASTFRSGFFFATVFYLLFFIINIAHNIREKKKFLASDFSILLANTALYFAVGLYCLTAMKGGEYRGLFTAALGIFNLGVTFALFRNQRIDSNILYLLIGITLSFISLTAPIQLNGNNITLFWASEAVLLYWLFQKSRIRIIRLASLVVWTAMLVSLFMDWINVYGQGAKLIPVVINKGFITTLFSAIASYLLFILRTKDQAGDLSPEKNLFEAGISPHKNIFRTAGILLLFAAGALEILYQFNYHYAGTNLQLLYLLLYTFAFALIFNWITGTVELLRTHRNIKAGTLLLCVTLYLLSIPAVFAIQRELLEEQRLTGHFTAHWLGAILMGILLYRLVTVQRDSETFARKNNNAFAWLFCVVVVIYLSAETQLLVNMVLYDDRHPLAEIQRVFIKTGLPILWGLCSFGFMWLGMKHKYRTLRIISLTLFSIILLKLFLFDIRNIPVAGKIAAFFCLGILLLIVSFMYQRLKKIIIEDEKKPSV